MAQAKPEVVNPSGGNGVSVPTNFDPLAIALDFAPWIFIALVAFWFISKRRQAAGLARIIDTQKTLEELRVKDIAQYLKALGTPSRRKLFHGGVYVGQIAREALYIQNYEDEKGKLKEKQYLLLEVWRSPPINIFGFQIGGVARYYVLDKEVITENADAIFIPANTPMRRFGGVWHTWTEGAHQIIMDLTFQRILEGELGALEEMAKHVATYHDYLMASELHKVETEGKWGAFAREQKRDKKALGL